MTQVIHIYLSGVKSLFMSAECERHFTAGYYMIASFPK
jgi:hypothetical protein